jgi:hypothetical protein
MSDSDLETLLDELRRRRSHRGDASIFEKGLGTRG